MTGGGGRRYFFKRSFLLSTLPAVPTAAPSMAVTVPVPASLLAPFAAVLPGAVRPPAARSLFRLLHTVHTAAAGQQAGQVCTAVGIELRLFGGGSGADSVDLGGAQLRPLLPHLGCQISDPLTGVHQPGVATYLVTLLRLLLTLAAP